MFGYILEMVLTLYKIQSGNNKELIANSNINPKNYFFLFHLFSFFIITGLF